MIFTGTRPGVGATGAAQRPSFLIVAASFVIVAAALHLARDILIPLALSVLLSFFLGPLVRRFVRWGLPNVAAVLTTVGIAFAVIGLIGWLVSAQLVNLVQELPQYEENIRAKIEAVKSSGPGFFSEAERLVGEIKTEIEEQEEDRAAQPPSQAKPVPVQIQPPPSTPLQLLRDFAGPLIGPLGIAGIVMILVIFMLLQRDDLRDRLFRLVSGGELNIATQAVDEAGRRITRYLLMQTIINASYGVPIGVGLYLIGVPNALLWGLLATLLRFLPFIGPWIAAIFPVTLSIAVGADWTMPLLTIGLFLVMELISNNVMEPWLYGSSTGISAVALIIAAIFWTWLWGPVGLFLSTPLTVCLLVMGKYIPSLGFFNVILGTEPVLAGEAQFYQRMLAMDPDAMSDLADKYLKNQSLTGFYDTILVPALSMAERDRHNGRLPENRQQFIFQGTEELIEELIERRATPEEAPGREPRMRVLCLPAKDEADELTARMLSHILREHGIAAEFAEVTFSSTALADTLRSGKFDVVCLCAIPPLAVASARKMCRRLRATVPDQRVLVGIWGTRLSATEIKSRLANNCPDLIATNFADALGQLEHAAPAAPPPELAPEATRKEQRLTEIRTLELLDTEPEEFFDAVTRELARTFDVPISLVSLVDSDREFWKAHTGRPPESARARDYASETPICGHMVTGSELVVVEDVLRDDRFSDNPLLRERGIRFYAGAPLRTRSGYVVGSLCVVDTKPRQASGQELATLERLAADVMEYTESRHSSQAAREASTPS